ncbi:MAG: Na(+)/H(+) antiporter subunit B [Arenicellales bacterium]|mgnify:FL=1|jgi:multicomponent Na+:H+ antiporter subunit B|nr:Na(+)/H(+) antiporter subunit B [Arenicellales bacterium]HCV20197.1 cation:proton antiporter [Gammaproteobacteria bacterium]MDP6314235.1 Na(+)/H(+) antiporter subunit B [Arenicellales bacterium]MDP7119727.1 Na(+)/H(+) antiporter subunit B [Arenicellales bacterium]MDP7192783.1 Na(+)/H(+) antiporter subunit B [Arenicellales bacterium]|tara:strand:+ start:1694 stop:2113 length:420 start_codon:yes stop_codon:yes gene_type:complete
MRDNPVLRVVTKITLPLIFLFALYVQFHGDFGPGGGFQAGVIFAAGFILYGLVFGTEALRAAVPAAVLRLGIALGLMLYAGVGVVTLGLGGEYLAYGTLAHTAAHGQHLGIFLVELGVGVTVAAVMVAVFLAFAGRADP